LFVNPNAGVYLKAFKVQKVKRNKIKELHELHVVSHVNKYMSPFCVFVKCMSTSFIVVSYSASFPSIR